MFQSHRHNHHNHFRIFFLFGYLTHVSETNVHYLILLRHLTSGNLLQLSDVAVESVRIAAVCVGVLVLPEGIV